MKVVAGGGGEGGIAWFEGGRKCCGSLRDVHPQGVYGWDVCLTRDHYTRSGGEGFIGSENDAYRISERSQVVAEPS
ncbi:Hypothetical protein PP7435_CHR4-0403 [Komagataella phaffii CBS 7435]|uniref:Uncharacterized protein n=1 Tax=Komagataella phaffii (strain ATCC 76273 / CBS 7435 / CECT 11047 / NRRL Y-11430 / Wegner 21-1) TaxID=981350 RepID=F2QYU2_KOMPC|nr:Hypothetical protein BQ9382_C4-2098 [Komagataella phaffii CBS 7435]CCA40570.1 Hypothetical protein PP7435_CHR4-0403 [Komagataella phaffii CBS 7435]